MHDRKLVIGMVAKVPGRVRHAIWAANEVRNQLEEVLISENFFEGAPFNWVGLILRYGLANSDEPEYQPINKEHGDLPITMELDIGDLLNAEKEEVKRIFYVATLKALVHVGERHCLPRAALKNSLSTELEN